MWMARISQSVVHWICPSDTGQQQEKKTDRNEVKKSGAGELFGLIIVIARCRAAEGPLYVQLWRPFHDQLAVVDRVAY